MQTDLVLVGGGHAHVQVLRRFLMRPLPGVRLSVVLDRPEAVYSGMVPGFVAGDYEASELEIDVVPLARRARARVVLAAALRVDANARRIELEGRAPLAYDVASLDVGSSVRDLDLPGVGAHAVATRPIRAFVDRLDAAVAGASASRDRQPLRLVVVGAGAAGVELAFTLDARLRGAGRAASVCIVCASPEVLPGSAPGVVRAVHAEAARRGIELHCDARVSAVAADAVVLEGERRIAGDLIVWATGAAPPALLGASALPLDGDGFVRVRDTLQVVGHDRLFAVGDCAQLDAHSWVPKAGVYAVRQGPVLDANLRALLTGGTLRRYRPQRDFLALLNLGGRRALGTKWGRVARGAAVWRLKDWIDRRFVRRFRVLDGSGAPAAGFPSPRSMGMEEMPCGGCAAKVGATALEAALARLDKSPADPSVLLGLDAPDDAAALALPRGDVLLASVDGFRAFTDDPWLVGRVAAVNAVSDVFAKGGRPRHALALVTVPEESVEGAEETLYQVLSGVRAALDPLGVSLVGGHSTRGDELFVALSVTGDLGDADDVLPLDGARPGERLVLTKPLGSGVLLAADMQGLARGAWMRAVFASLVRDNAAAARVARACGASACTDVSGFGLAGHLGELLRASGVSVDLDLGALPVFDGALALLARGVRSTFHEQNARTRTGVAVASGGPRAALLHDPQTSGGLLFSVAPERAAAAVRALHDAGDPAAAVVGTFSKPRR